jgi:1-acyl-sn-glycerol-3-phosphate acyltransferase
MRDYLLSAWVWTSTALLRCAWLPVMAAVRLTDRDPALYRSGYALRILGRLMTYLNPFWTVETEGQIPDNPRNPYIVVSNHLSQAAPPVVSRLPWEMKWVGKKSLFELPVAGWLLRMSGDICVDRRDAESRSAVLDKARHYLDHRCSVMLCSEGTRSRDGRVHSFANGAFRLALDAGVPVVPIAIDGTQDALPKHSLVFRTSPQTMRVKVLSPVDPVAEGLTDIDAFRAHVRRQIVEQIAAWRGVDPVQVDAEASTPETA